jgi:hypothetical protein
MPTDHIIDLLIAERDKLDAAIAALQGSSSVKRRGRPPRATAHTAAPEAVNGPAPAGSKRKRTFTAAQRKQQAERMRQYWAAKRKAGAKAKKAA